MFQALSFNILMCCKCLCLDAWSSSVCFFQNTQKVQKNSDFKYLYFYLYRHFMREVGLYVLFKTQKVQKNTDYKYSFFIILFKPLLSASSQDEP